MSNIFDKTLQENTLFELFKSEAQTDTERALRLAITQITDAISKTTGEWTLSERKRIKALIAQEILNAYSGLEEGLRIELAAAAVITAHNMIGPTFQSVPTAVINEITSPNRLVQGYSMRELFNTTSQNHARQLQVVLGSGIARALSTDQIVREVRSKHARLTASQLNNAVFTTITEARESARHYAYGELEKQDLIDGYEYVAVLDSGTTEYCREHDGRKYYKPIEEISHLIKVHFHCRSVFVPLNDYTDEDGNLRASAAGPVPDVSYGSWFRDQPDDFKRLTLGRKKFDAYKAGSYTVQGVSDIQGRTLSLDRIDGYLNS